MVLISPFLTFEENRVNIQIVEYVRNNTTFWMYISTSYKTYDGGSLVFTFTVIDILL